MYTHPSLRVCLAFLFGVFLLVSHITASPLDAYTIAPVLRYGGRTNLANRRAFLVATDALTGQLDKRDGTLVTLYNSVKNADKVKTGATGQWELYPTKGSAAAVYAPSEFYG